MTSLPGERESGRSIIARFIDRRSGFDQYFHCFLMAIAGTQMKWSPAFEGGWGFAAIPYFVNRSTSINQQPHDLTVATLCAAEKWKRVVVLYFVDGSPRF